jgi:hypothetical protein
VECRSFCCRSGPSYSSTYGYSTGQNSYFVRVCATIRAQKNDDTGTCGLSVLSSRAACLVVPHDIGPFPCSLYLLYSVIILFYTGSESMSIRVSQKVEKPTGNLPYFSGLCTLRETVPPPLFFFMYIWLSTFSN